MQLAEILHNFNKAGPVEAAMQEEIRILQTKLQHSQARTTSAADSFKDSQIALQDAAELITVMKRNAIAHHLQALSTDDLEEDMLDEMVKTVATMHDLMINDGVTQEILAAHHQLQIYT